jgi:hypothetical protein
LEEMVTKIKLALAAALMLGTASAALASNENDRSENGGYVVPGSTDGVNPAYHPRWFPKYGRVMREYDRANQAIYSGVDGYYPSASAAYGWVNGRTPRAPHPR